MTDFSNLILISERLKLIPISIVYAHDICQHFTAEITHYMWPSAPKSLDEIKQHIEMRRAQMQNGKAISLMIIAKESGEFLGYTTLDEVESKSPLLSSKEQAFEIFKNSWKSLSACVGLRRLRSLLKKCYSLRY